MLFDLKTSASSNERIFMSGERDVVKPSGRLAEWMLNTIMESNFRSLDQLTASEIMYASNSDNLVTGYREHGFTRAVKYGHGCDPDESVHDALFMQYDRKQVRSRNSTHSRKYHQVGTLHRGTSTHGPQNCACRAASAHDRSSS